MTENNIHSNKALNSGAFEGLFREFFSVLCSFANNYLHNFDDSKEIVHDVFVRVWEKRKSIDATKPLKSYLFKSVHSRCLNFIRDNRRFYSEIELEIMALDDISESSDFVVYSEMKAKNREALNTLPEKCREIFELNRFEGLKYAQVAEKLGISVKTVETQMSKALKILREQLLKYLTFLFIILIDKLSG